MTTVTFPLHQRGGGGQGGRRQWGSPAPSSLFARAKFSSFPLHPFSPPLSLLPPPLLPPPLLPPPAPSSPPSLLPCPPPQRGNHWSYSKTEHNTLSHAIVICCPYCGVFCFLFALFVGYFFHLFIKCLSMDWNHFRNNQYLHNYDWPFVVL